MWSGHPRARPGAVHSAARGSAHHGTCPCTGRSGRLRHTLGSCVAIPRRSGCGPTWRCRGRRTAARAGRRLQSRSTHGTSTPPLPFWRAALECCRAAGAFDSARKANLAQVFQRGDSCGHSWSETVSYCTTRRVTLQNDLSASPRAARLARRTASRLRRRARAAPRRRAARRVGGCGRERRESATALLLVEPGKGIMGG